VRRSLSTRLSVAVHRCYQRALFTRCECPLMRVVMGPTVSPCTVSPGTVALWWEVSLCPVGARRCPPTIHDSHALLYLASPQAAMFLK